MLNISEQFVLKHIIDEGGLEEIPKSINLINKYMIGEFYPSKNKRLTEWYKTTPEPTILIIAIFTVVLMNDSITYQAIISRLSHMIKVKANYDKFKIIADIIGLISKTGLIDINKPGQGQYINITTNYEITDIPVVEKHMVVIDRPQPIESNWDPEYHSMLLGHPMNHHEYDICLDHLNKLNQIPFKLNEAFIDTYTETPKNEPLTQKTKDQWKQFMGDSADKYTELLQHSKKFYLIHKPDTRGRTYACGYHITTQGTSFKKAMIELADEELIQG